MKKLLLCTLLACTFAAASASAKDFKLPDADAGVASVSIPDKWKPEAIDGGVQGNSPDNEVYISIVATDSKKGFEDDLDSTEKMLKENKVTLDMASKKEHKFKLAGADATELQYDGKLGDEVQTVSIVFVPMKDKMVIFTYWSSAAGDKDKADSAAVGEILKSLKAL